MSEQETQEKSTFPVNLQPIQEPLKGQDKFVEGLRYTYNEETVQNTEPNETAVTNLKLLYQKGFHNVTFPVPDAPVDLALHKGELPGTSQLAEDERYKLMQEVTKDAHGVDEVSKYLDEQKKKQAQENTDSSATTAPGGDGVVIPNTGTGGDFVPSLNDSDDGGDGLEHEVNPPPANGEPEPSVP